MVLIAFMVMQAVQLRRITRERDRADRITEFMTRMFKVSDPSHARGNTITVREILDKSSNQIESELARDPETKAQMLNVMGTVYQGLGLYARADQLMKQAVDIRTRVLGPEHHDTLDSSGRMARILQGEGRYAEAEQVERKLIAVEQRVLGPNDRTTLAEESSLAWILEDEGQAGNAEQLLALPANVSFEPLARTIPTRWNPCAAWLGYWGAKGNMQKQKGLGVRPLIAESASWDRKTFIPS